MIKNPARLYGYLGAELSKFTDIAVLGLSGGADSTLVAALCVAAVGANNVYAIGMPYSYVDQTPGKFNNLSGKIAKKLGLNYASCSITRPADYITERVASLFGCSSDSGGNIFRGNARSRVRMATLYAVANFISEKNPGKRVRVIGTGNLSEDFIGYDTKGGDAVTDIFPIGRLFKSEVYQLLDYLIEIKVLDSDMVDRVPSAGLWAGQTDEGELGYTYAGMEKAIRQMITKDRSGMKNFVKTGTPIKKFVYDRHYANKHKHEGPPTIPVAHLCS